MKLEILDFTARWCGPCKTLKPVLESVAHDYKIPVTEIDVDDDPARAEMMQVRSMPTVVILRDGREVGRIVGARNRAWVAGVIARAVNGESAIANP